MRIAFISLMYDASWGGSEVLWAQTANQALVEGHEVFVSTHFWPTLAEPLQKLTKSGAKFYFRPRYQDTLQFKATSWLSRLPRGGRLPEIDALRHFDPEVVVISQGGWNDLFFHAQLRSWVQKLPFILICHNYHDPVRQNEYLRTQMIDLFSRAQEVLMISELQLRVLRRQLASPLSNARLVQNPLNLPSAYPIPYPELTELTIPQLAVIGSFDVDRKGQDILLEVLSAPLWRERAWHLNLYGQGPDKGYLAKLIASYGLHDRVTMHGHVADSESIWSKTHLLIVPSRIESGPMVVQEAVLCGRPIVAADVGLVRNWIQDGKTGFIADTASVYALDKAINEAWLHWPEWSAMGKAAAILGQELQIPNPVEDMLSHIIAAHLTTAAGE